MVSIKTPVRFLEAVVLDLISIPGAFMDKKGNARWHLNYMCPLCSEWRKSFRDPEKGEECLWYKAWRKGKYRFSRCFGFRNWLRYYAGLRTDLEKYEKEFKQ